MSSPLFSAVAASIFFLFLTAYGRVFLLIARPLYYCTFAFHSGFSSTMQGNLFPPGSSGSIALRQN